MPFWKRFSPPNKKLDLKASGGIRTLEEAKKYLVLANAVMGPGWVSPQTFRIGASSLLTNLLQVLNQG